MKQYSLYNGKIIINFEGENEGHKFYDEKGRQLLSVTKVSGLIDKSNILMGWAIKLMGQYLINEMVNGNDRITEELIETAKKKYKEAQMEAKDIGKEIHEWISQWILGKKPKMPENEKVVNGISAFLKFQKENKFKWIESERIVYSKKHNYAGFLDAVAMNVKERILVDFKSSNGIYPEMVLQVAGYKIAYEEETKKKIDRAMIIRLGKETGEFEVRELDDMGKDEKAFLGLLAATKRLEEFKNGR